MKRRATLVVDGGVVTKKSAQRGTLFANTILVLLAGAVARAR